MAAVRSRMGLTVINNVIKKVLTKNTYITGTCAMNTRAITKIRYDNGIKGQAKKKELRLVNAERAQTTINFKKNIRREIFLDEQVSDDYDGSMPNDDGPFRALITVFETSRRRDSDTRKIVEASQPVAPEMASRQATPSIHRFTSPFLGIGTRRSYRLQLRQTIIYSDTQPHAPRPNHQRKSC
jgi:hypothetical protein